MARGLSVAAGLVVGLIVGAGGTLAVTGGMHDMEGMDGMGHSSMAAMEGMTPADGASGAQIPGMEGMGGMMMQDTGNPDRDFMANMIPHHEGAVVMARDVLETGSDPEVLALAQNVIDSQEAEIAMMKAWLARNEGTEPAADGVVAPEGTTETPAETPAN